MNSKLLSIEVFVNKLLRLRCRLADLKSKQPSLKDWPNEFPSPDSIKEVLMASYYLSLEQYEGRNIRTVLNWMHPVASQAFIHRFNRPLDDFSVKTMRQLAQVADGMNGKLGLVIEGENLALAGIYFCWPGFGKLEQSFVPGITISIKDPGHLEYQEGYLVLGYRKGKKERLRPLDKCQVIQSLLENIDIKLQEKATSSLRNHNAWKDSAETPKYPAEIARTFLCSTIRAIEYSGHGGTLIILPDSNSAQHIDIRFPANSNDFSRLVELMGEASICAQRHGHDTDSMFSPALLHNNVGMTNVDVFGKAIGQLSGCDGATVMNREGELLGFGGIIQPSKLSGSAETKQQRSRGARHTSAEWICESVPGTIAIVVSADRSITLIHSISGEIKIIKGLSVR